MGILGSKSWTSWRDEWLLQTLPWQITLPPIPPLCVYHRALVLILGKLITHPVQFLHSVLREQFQFFPYCSIYTNRPHVDTGAIPSPGGSAEIPASWGCGGTRGSAGRSSTGTVYPGWGSPLSPSAWLAAAPRLPRHTEYLQRDSPIIYRIQKQDLLHFPMVFHTVLELPGDLESKPVSKYETKYALVVGYGWRKYVDIMSGDESDDPNMWPKTKEVQDL